MEEEPSNLELIRRFRARDDAAGAALVERHYRFLLRTAMRRASGDRVTAEDAVQEAFARFFDKLPESNFQSNAHVNSWLFLAVRRIIQEGRRHTSPEPIFDDSLADCWDADHDLLMAELRAAFARYRTHFAADDWKILWLHYCEGVKYAEIAELLELEAGAVRMRASRAIQHLRELLIADGWSPNDQE